MMSEAEKNAAAADKSSKKTVSLVLGSGGARGLAHIGVIEYLLQQGYDIRAISGSSMGALVGGMYAMDKLESYRDWVCGLSQTDFLGLVDWTFSGGGLIRGHKIIDKLRELTGEANIEDLPLNYTAVAVDIDHGREVWFSDGPLYDAIRASIAIPAVFTPHRYRGRTLVDGGLLNPVPVAPTLRTLTDLTIVVNVNGPETTTGTAPWNDDEQQEPSAQENSNGVVAKIKDFIDSFSNERSPKSGMPGLMAVLIRSLETMESVIARQHLAVFRPDLVINIPKNICMIHEFNKGGEVIQLGRKLAETEFQRHASGYSTDPLSSRARGGAKEPPSN